VYLPYSSEGFGPKRKSISNLDEITKKAPDHRRIFVTQPPSFSFSSLIPLPLQGLAMNKVMEITYKLYRPEWNGDGCPTCYPHTSTKWAPSFGFCLNQEWKASLTFSNARTDWKMIYQTLILVRLFPFSSRDIICDKITIIFCINLLWSKYMWTRKYQMENALHKLIPCPINAKP